MIQYNLFFVFLGSHYIVQADMSALEISLKNALRKGLWMVCINCLSCQKAWMNELVKILDNY